MKLDGGVESSCTFWSSGMHFNINFEKTKPSNHLHMANLRKSAEPKNKPKSNISAQSISQLHMNTEKIEDFGDIDICSCHSYVPCCNCHGKNGKWTMFK